jgi:hypothetical protein
MLQMTYIYLMKIKVAYESRPAGRRVKPFGRKAAGPKERGLMFEDKFLIHATNTILGIVYKIKRVRMPISLRRISTLLVAKKFGKTRPHAGVHQTVAEFIKMMEDDEAMQFISVQDTVKNRRLA